MFTDVCCHGNSLQHTHISIKELNPRCFANLQCKFQELKFKAEKNSLVLVLHPSSCVCTVNYKTVGRHFPWSHTFILCFPLPGLTKSKINFFSNENTRERRFPCKLIFKHKLRKAMPQRKLSNKSMQHRTLVEDLISSYDELQLKNRS